MNKKFNFKNAQGVGIILMGLGFFLDRILYLQVFLASKGRAYDWAGRLDDVFSYYTNTYALIPVALILVGIICMFIGKRN
ncbi:hypothetical protein P0Y35_06925 [Kiritimatiellaeota bacterium B1221]|nr:hypothetical protein [Kiritimatiellaeota bacterium B1221]